MRSLNSFIAAAKSLFAAFLFLSGIPHLEAAPTMIISDGVTSITVVDDGPNDSLLLPGWIQYQGSIGVWSLTVNTAITKPLIGSQIAPSLDVNTSSTSTGPGTLTITFSDTDYGPTVGVATAGIGGSLSPGATVRYETKVSNANIQFAGVPLTAPLTYNVHPFSGSTTANLNIPGSYALTQTVVITHVAAGRSAADAALNVATGAIGDFVWKDLNQNGIQEPGEPGIDGVTVTLKNSSDAVIATTVTANNGFYQFTGLTAGTYVVTVDTASGPLVGLFPSPLGASGSADDSNPNPSTVVLETDSSTDYTIDFGFYAVAPALGSIGDYVWMDINQDGIQQPNEAGINGVTVKLKNGDGNLLATTTTAGNGSYLFPNLPAGTYIVCVDASSPALAGLVPTPSIAPGSNTANDSNDNPATVILANNGASDLTIDFGYIPTPAGTIGDFVWRDLNGDGIQGNAVDEPGIPGVTVKLYSGNTLLATTTTDADGYYLFSGLKAGTYTVVAPTSLVLEGFTYNPTTANSPGSTPANDSNPIPATVVLPLNTSRDTSIDFGYVPVPAGRIGNFVWNDLNGNGIQDVGEPGISGVGVTLLSPADVVLATATTDATGAYLFTGLSEGTYKVSVNTASASLSGFIATTTNAVGSTTANDSNPNPSTVTLATNTSSDLTQDFGYLKPTGKIGDFVWKDLNQDGIQNVGEPGIGGVTVKLYDAGNVLLATTTTSSTGAYLFTGLKAGTYTVAVVNSSTPLVGLIPTDNNVPGSTTLNDSDLNPVQVTLPTHSSVDLSIDFGFIPVPAGCIGDFVWKDLNGNGIQDVGEPGIGGVSVRLTRSGNPTVLGTAVTDANGVYLFTGLSAGGYVVTLDLSSPSLAGLSPTIVNAGGSTTDSNQNPALVILATNTSKDLTIDFGFVAPPTGRIGDFVWNDLNRDGIQNTAEPGINGVTVRLYNSANALVATAVTSGNGAYLFTGLKAGTYKVVVDTASPSLAGFSATTSNASGSTAANDSNSSPASVVLATNSSSDLTIDFGYKLPPPKCFTTYTMGGWGACPSGNNPGTLLKNNFTKVYPKGLVLGGNYKLTFTGQLGIQNFLPVNGAGTPRALTKNYTNPTTALGVLAGQTTALRLNVDFSNAGILPTGLKNALFTSGTFKGKTVGYVLTLAESVLGGAPLPSGMSYSTISDACALVNQNYDAGKNSGLMSP